MKTVTAAEIESELPAAVRDRLTDLVVADSVSSTNTLLMEGEPPAPGRWRVLLAREQTAGRGRSGSHWYSPPGGGLWMSAAYTFSQAESADSAFTLALGSSVAAALERLGVDTIRLKWPNDLLVDGRKLGGLLVETRDNGRTMVCGLGINRSLGDRAEVEGIALEPIDLAAVLEPLPSAATLAASMLSAFVYAQQRFAAEGAAAFVDAWSRYDWLRGKEVCVSGIRPELRGTARGIGEDGALLVESRTAEYRVVAGTVRVLEPRA